MAGMIISGVTFGLAALIMIGIGISQLKSRNPVGFYTNYRMSMPGTGSMAPCGSFTGCSLWGYGSFLH